MKHTEQSAKDSLSKKFDINIKGRLIEHLRNGKGDVGNGSWGKIDYLCGQHGYAHIFVDKFSK